MSKIKLIDKLLVNSRFKKGKITFVSIFEEGEHFKATVFVKTGEKFTHEEFLFSSYEEAIEKIPPVSKDCRILDDKGIYWGDSNG